MLIQVGLLSLLSKEAYLILFLRPPKGLTGNRLNLIFIHR